jgi:hypothetical protein
VKNILQRATLISLLAFVMSSRACAVEGTAQEFLDRYEHADVTERQTLLVLIKGLEDGVSWANASNQAHGVARLYCPPGKIFYQQPEDLIDMLRREVEARPDIGREPWQLATIEAQGVSMQAAKTFVVRCRHDDRRQSARTRVILEC